MNIGSLDLDFSIEKLSYMGFKFYRIKCMDRCPDNEISVIIVVLIRYLFSSLLNLIIFLTNKDLVFTRYFFIRHYFIVP